jgi:HlyD family secretion protein
MTRAHSWYRVATAALCLAAVASCQRTPPPEPQKEAAAAAPAVPIIHPARQSLIRQVRQPGWVRAFEQTPIYSKIPGYVEQVNVDIDSRVKKGDLLVKLFVPELEKDYDAKKARVTQAEADIKQAEQALLAAEASVNTAAAIVSEAEAGVEKAEADFKRWSAEYDRGQRLFQAKVYDEQTLVETRNQMDQAKAGVHQTQARVKSSQASREESKAKYAKAQADVSSTKARYEVASADRDQALAWLNYRDLTAPYDGVITLRNVHTGHLLQSSSSGTNNLNAEPLLVMVRTDPVRVNVQIPEYDAVHIKKGMPAVVRFPGTTIPEHKGTVTIDSYAVDEQARTLRAEIHLANPRNLLRPGLFTDVNITVQLPETMTLPVEALMNEGDSHYCYVVEGGKAVRTAVRVGAKTDKFIQVLQRQERHVGDPRNDHWEEFTGREDIIARNPAAIVDGQLVDVKATAP